MSDIFANHTMMGSYVSEKSPARLLIDGYAGNENLFLTKMTGSLTPNYQLMYSIGSQVFLNAFAQRMTFWNLSGFHLFEQCSGTGTSPDQAVPEFLNFYNANNIVKAKEALILSFIGITLHGYLVNLQIDDFKKSSGADTIEGVFYTLVFLGKQPDAGTASAPEPQQVVPAPTTAVRSASVQPQSTVL